MIAVRIALAAIIVLAVAIAIYRIVFKGPELAKPLGRTSSQPRTAGATTAWGTGKEGDRHVR